MQWLRLCIPRVNESHMVQLSLCCVVSVSDKSQYVEILIEYLHRKGQTKLRYGISDILKPCCKELLLSFNVMSRLST
jgi:hypothetical protein